MYHRNAANTTDGQTQSAALTCKAHILTVLVPLALLSASPAPSTATTTTRWPLTTALYKGI